MRTLPIVDPRRRRSDVLPGTFWTAAHHQICRSSMVMHNNRAYHQELMHVQRMADRHERGIDRTRIGTVIDDPGDRLRQAGGQHGRCGRGTDHRSERSGSGDQAGARAGEVGQPALVDVVCQPR